MEEYPHPWHELRDDLPDWTVVWDRLPLGQLGYTDHDRREIVLDPDQLQAERRTTLAHELVHVERGDTHECDSKVERDIERRVAFKLIPPSLLADAVKWARTGGELAEELFVDIDLLQIRIDHMCDAERDHIRAIIAAKELSA